CGAGTAEQAGSPGAEAGDVASLQLNVLLPDNSQITSVTYDVSGPATRHGMVGVGTSRTIRFRVDSLPISSAAYLLDLHAASSTGVSCHGQQDFHIASPDLTVLSVTLSCGDDVDGNGDLAVSADVKGNCPIITGISTEPSEVQV